MTSSDVYALGWMIFASCSALGLCVMIAGHEISEAIKGKNKEREEESGG